MCYAQYNDYLKDACWEAGRGFVFTSNSYHLLLRLDHRHYSNEFKIKNCRVLDNYKFSAHYPLVVDFELR